MAVDINPKKLVGSWQDGYSLDVHTIESRLIGYNAFGHAEFSTKRSPLGELLFRLKYRSDRKCIEPIVETATNFLSAWDIRPTLIVPVPPSNTARTHQPVLEIAKQLARHAELALCVECVKKIKKTPQIKDVIDLGERMDALAEAYAIDEEETSGKRILLFDDLYQTGSTLNTIARALKKDGRARTVYVLTLTRTRNA
jgi:competence protein ComFC